MSVILINTESTSCLSFSLLVFYAEGCIKPKHRIKQWTTIQEWIASSTDTAVGKVLPLSGVFFPVFQRPPHTYMGLGSEADHLTFLSSLYSEVLCIQDTLQLIWSPWDTHRLRLSWLTVYSSKKVYPLSLFLWPQWHGKTWL